MTHPRPATPHEPIDAADPDSMCKPECARCREMVDAADAELDAGAFGAGYAGSLGPQDVQVGVSRDEFNALKRKVDDLGRLVTRLSYLGRNP